MARSTNYLQPWHPLALVLVLSMLLYKGHAAYHATMLVGEVAQRDLERHVYDVKLPRLEMRTAPGAIDAAMVPGLTTMRMVTARGQAMRCTLPPPPTAPLSPASSVTNVSFDDIDELFRDFESECFFRRDEWWTYEFCYGQHVVQKHVIPKDREPHEGEVEESFVLGKFDKELDVARRKNASTVLTRDSAFTQLFVNGTVCDKTGQPRQVVVKYLCSDDALHLKGILKKKKVDVNLLVTIREVASCIYEAEFMNGAICKHPSYIQRVSRSRRQVHCSMEESEGTFQGLLYSKGYKEVSLNL